MTRALKTIYTIWLREAKTFWREKARIVAMIGQPLLYLLILGNGITAGMRLNRAGAVGYIQFLYPGVIAMSILFTSIFSALSIIWDREFGFLREVLVSPMPRVAILTGKILGGTTVAMFHGALVLALARFADLPLTLADLATGLTLMFLLAFALTALGVVIANRIRSFEGFGVFSNVVILPLYFLSSSIFPLDPSLTSAQTRVIYPEWLVVLVELNPLTYAIDALRGAFIHFHQFDWWLGPAVMIAMAVVFFLVAWRDFRRV